MNVLCRLGRHRWNGCECARCGTSKHEWRATSTEVVRTDDPVLTICYKERCEICGAERSDVMRHPALTPDDLSD